MTAPYTIDGSAPGKARVDVLARACEPGTSALLDRVGIPSGAVEGVAPANEVAQAVLDLYAQAADSTTVMGMPRLVQAWGRVAR